MLRTIFCLLILNTCLTSTLWAVETGCVERHIQDAISINKLRLKLYQRESRPAEKQFKKLILMEKLMILPSRYLDARARIYNQEGHRLFCDDLVPMRTVPEFSGTKAPPTTSYSPVTKEDIHAVKKNLSQALNAGREEFKQAITQQLQTFLKRPKEYHCLTRHFLESMAKAASNWSRYEKEAQDLKLPSPDKLMTSYLKNHLLALGLVAKLDRNAAGIQEQGLALFCQDVPPISSQE